jgi:putative AdoMet-dependent methyltransferase
MPSSFPDWYYDDRKQVGLDFSSETEVATYDERQTGRLEDDRRLLGSLSLSQGQTMADIGCGTGLLVAAAAGLCGQVHAIDISAGMLSATMRRASALGLTNILPQRAGFLSFEVEPGSLDLVTTKFALHHLPDLWKGVALARVRDALQPGGRLFLRDVVFNCRPSELPALAESWIGWMEANTGYSRAEAASHIRDEHSTYAWVMQRLIVEEGSSFSLPSTRLQSMPTTSPLRDSRHALIGKRARRIGVQPY